MSNAYGFIEITGVVAAMDALDIMCKAANVTLATWERKLGGRLVTLVVEGDVSASRFKGKQEPSSEAKMLGEDPPDFVPKEKPAHKSSKSNNNKK